MCLVSKPPPPYFLAGQRPGQEVVNKVLKVTCYIYGTAMLSANSGHLTSCWLLRNLSDLT